MRLSHVVLVELLALAYILGTFAEEGGIRQEVADRLRETRERIEATRSQWKARAAKMEEEQGFGDSPDRVCQTCKAMIEQAKAFLKKNDNAEGSARVELERFFAEDVCPTQLSTSMCRMIATQHAAALIESVVSGEQAEAACVEADLCDVDAASLRPGEQVRRAADRLSALHRASHDTRRRRLSEAAGGDGGFDLDTIEQHRRDMDARRRDAEARRKEVLEQMQAKFKQAGDGDSTMEENFKRRVEELYGKKPDARRGGNDD